MSDDAGGTTGSVRRAREGRRTLRERRLWAAGLPASTGLVGLLVVAKDLARVASGAPLDASRATILAGGLLHVAATAWLVRETLAGPGLRRAAAVATWSLMSTALFAALSWTQRPPANLGGALGGALFMTVFMATSTWFALRTVEQNAA